MNSRNFFQNHTLMYELISMNNGKFALWKLTFPRVGDTYMTHVTGNKLLDLRIFEELYSVLKRITIETNVCAPTTLIAEQLIGDKQQYSLCFQKIPLRKSDCKLFDVDKKLLHNEIFCVDLVLNKGSNETVVKTIPICEKKNSVSSSGNGNSKDVSSASKPCSINRSNNSSKKRRLNPQSHNKAASTCTNKKNFSTFESSSESDDALEKVQSFRPRHPYHEDNNNSSSESLENGYNESIVKKFPIGKKRNFASSLDKNCNGNFKAVSITTKQSSTDNSLKKVQSLPQGSSRKDNIYSSSDDSSSDDSSSESSSSSSSESYINERSQEMITSHTMS